VNGITLVVLGRKAGVSRSWLSEFERDLVKSTPKQLHRITEALGELLAAKRRLVSVAKEVGWPTESL
jgi:hypothetical protein